MPRGAGPSTPPPWACGLCTMDDFAEGDFAVGDYAFLGDCPCEEDSVFAPGFMADEYVRVTQLFCDGVGMRYKDYAQIERNLEFDICTIWCSKPISVLQDYCDAIKVYLLWPLLFQHPHNSVLSRLHPCVENANFSAAELSLKKLQHLELMEDIVDLAKKVANDPFLIEGLLKIGYKIENKILAMEEAINWIKYTGDVTILPKLGSVDNCWPMLSVFFTEYKFYITKAVTENCNLLEEFKTRSCMDCIEQGELMKMKGNEEFAKGRFDLAIIYYTRAIEYRPENHLLYGNRALCFLHTGQFRNAVGDGKRAIILKNSWPKGHYRYCDALSMLGEYDWALQANIKAQKLCKNDPEGIKDLIQQHVKLQKQIEDLQGRTTTKNPIKAFYESRAGTPRTFPAPTFSTSLNFVEMERDFRKTNYTMAGGGNHSIKAVDEAIKVDGCECHPEFTAPPSQPPKHKGKQKSRNNESEKFSSGSQLALPIDLKALLEKQFSKSSRAASQDFANIMKMLRSLIQDGYTALLEQRCRSAAQSFTELLNGLDPQKIKQLNLAMINYVLVVYGLAISLLGIGQPEELSEAENQFKRIVEHYPNEGLDCLAYCGIGKVYLKKNRFLEALNHFEKAKTLICRLPGVLTWPTSNVVIEESHPEKVKMLIEKFVEECRFPPVPDAICCYQKCRGYSKIQIYITDPDFKGFIRISCCQYCKIEFHMNCWKKLKTTTFNDKIDKDFLQGICLTPDCEGIISKIIIFSSGGQVKCEFEHKVTKAKVPRRPILKQKCSSLEKLRLKEDKKIKRKIQKQEAKKLAQERMEEDLRESSQPRNEEQKAPTGHVQNCQFLDDRILQCIKQYADKIQSGVLNTSKLLKELLSWKVLSTENYTTCFSSKNFLNEAVDYVIRHLVQEKNRVKTRIFLHVLSELKEVEPKLATWIQKLNGFGLDATGHFLSRYRASLKELDFSILPFLWSEKYGHKLKSIQGKQLDYFCQPTSLKEARCLIWLLEEHRDKFPALHSALDEFFDIMDSRCTILRKQDSGETPLSSTKVKNKGKKKKPKDSKPMLVGSGKTSVTPNNETATSGEDRKRSSGSAGPFAVPAHLRQDVEEFEALYDQHSNEYVVRNKKVWEINPKQKSSTLYDYFSQLLEEHGPLDMSNKMFSEEYEFFPEETRQILQKAGGLKSFLLGCPRFVVIDNCIALRKVALRLKKKRKKKNFKAKVEEISKTGEYLQAKLPLNPAAREFKPDVKSSTVSDVPIAPASEDAKPTPVSASCPQTACADGKPTQASEQHSSQPLPENGHPKGPPSNSPKHIVEETNHKRVSSHSPKPVSEDMKPTYWTQSHLVTGYCTYLPFQGFDITQTPPAYINVLPSLTQYTAIYTPLPSIASEYQLQRSVAAVPAFVASDTADRNAAVDFEGCPMNPEQSAGHQPPLEQSVKSQHSMGDADLSSSKSHGRDGHCANPSMCETCAEHASEVADTPKTQSVGTQVSWSIIHQEVNTEPYEPIETQQGDISRIEKEYYLLQEQFQEAYEKYEQIKLKGLEETKDLEEKLKRNLEENKISKTELDWFHQDLEREIKKWQQEKREIQERLKSLKKKIKKLLHASEMSTQKNDGANEECDSRVDQSPEISNTFMNKKMKMEECVKKGKEHYEESQQRAVAAEVSVLENWKEREVYKLQAVGARAEAYLKNLEQKRSDSAAGPNIDSDIRAWKSFLSKVADEVKKTKSHFEEQIKAIKNGTPLSELSQGQASGLSLPPCTKMGPKVPPEPSGHADGGSVVSASSSPGNQVTDHKDSNLLSADARPVEVPSTPEKLSCGQPEATELAGPKRTGSGPAEQSPEAGEKLPAALGQAPEKPSSSIIEQLAVVFPCYSSTELAGFVKRARNKSKNSQSGLSAGEVIQRVTEHILDEQNKKKPNPGKGKRTVEASSAASATPASPSPASGAGGSSAPRTEEQKTGDAPASIAPDPGSCQVCHEVFKSKNMRVLKCGHKFHKGCLKQWLKGRDSCSACPKCDLQAEE
ncbi:E3 ubiquitin-protein ligase TTC3 isoform X2 [Ochotona princeps]|uniref:E3 ubiquitin-protein ligase TTC3 isoform X2 n=1 Tax=Ochotona princeps TaxID=9978 RepID=UPI002714F83D|nr:E3 ubiquitin-protein ligase TTC3 isoform X2 [Ochotona princeps]